MHRRGAPFSPSTQQAVRDWAACSLVLNSSILTKTWGAHILEVILYVYPHFPIEVLANSGSSPSWSAEVCTGQGISESNLPLGPEEYQPIIDPALGSAENHEAAIKTLEETQQVEAADDVLFRFS